MNKLLPIIFTILLIVHLGLGCILQPPSQYSSEPSLPKTGQEPPSATQVAAKAELVRALKDLKEKMATKIDIDIDNTAHTFFSVKDYWRAKRIADIVRAPLRVMEDTINLMAKAADLSTLTQTANAALDKSEATYQVLMIASMCQDLQQVGEKLHYAIDGPTYVSSIEKMLDAADATFVPPSGDNWQKYYEQVIRNYLYGPTDYSPLVIPRKSTTPERKNIEFVTSALQVRSSITQEFDKLIAEIEAIELPQGFPTGQVVSQIEELKKEVVASMGQGIDIRYKTYLGNQEVYVDTRLGAIGEYVKTFAEVALAVSKNLDIEITVEWLKLAQTAESAALLYTISYNKPGAREFVKVTQKATILPEIIIKPYTRTFYTDSETEFYMIPQEMVLILPTELSNLWMIADDTTHYIRYLMEAAVSKSAPVTLTLYVHEGSTGGPVISGALVAGQDGVGQAFSQTTNTAGCVIINGVPGTWVFSVSESCCHPSSCSWDITTNCTERVALVKKTPTPPPPAPPPAPPEQEPPKALGEARVVICQESLFYKPETGGLWGEVQNVGTTWAKDPYIVISYYDQRNYLLDQSRYDIKSFWAGKAKLAASQKWPFELTLRKDLIRDKGARYELEIKCSQASTSEINTFDAVRESLKQEFKTLHILGVTTKTLAMGLEGREFEVHNTGEKETSSMSVLITGYDEAGRVVMIDDAETPFSRISPLLPNQVGSFIYASRFIKEYKDLYGYPINMSRSYSLQFFHANTDTGIAVSHPQLEGRLVYGSELIEPPR